MEHNRSDWKKTMRDIDLDNPKSVEKLGEIFAPFVERMGSKIQADPEDIFISFFSGDMAGGLLKMFHHAMIRFVQEPTLDNLEKVMGELARYSSEDYAKNHVILTKAWLLPLREIDLAKTIIGMGICFTVYDAVIRNCADCLAVEKCGDEKKWEHYQELSRPVIMKYYDLNEAISAAGVDMVTHLINRAAANPNPEMLIRNSRDSLSASVQSAELTEPIEEFKIGHRADSRKMFSRLLNTPESNLPEWVGVMEEFLLIMVGILYKVNVGQAPAEINEIAIREYIDLSTDLER